MNKMRTQRYFSRPYGDFVLPFDIAKAGVRGRLVRLDAASARALGAHALPEPAARVAGETGGAGRAAGNRAEAGRAADHPDQGRRAARSGDGGLLWVGREDDENRHRGVRGYARLDAERFAALEAKEFDKLAGKGALAITIEPQVGGQTYQGIVELSPDGIAASAETYFAQSEQLPTVIRLAAAPLYVAGDKQPHWRAGGIMLQMTPEAAKPGGAGKPLRRLGAAVAAAEDGGRPGTGGYQPGARNPAVAAVPRRRSAGAARPSR